MRKLIIAAFAALICTTALADGITSKYDQRLLNGSRHIPVILVEFSDVKFTVSNPAQAFDDLFNKSGYSDNNATGSARDYWIENSGGKFTPTFDIYGPVAVSNTATYYGAGTSSQEKSDYCLMEAARLLDSSIDFSQYDYNSDGYIDPVIMIFAGHCSDAKVGGGEDKLKPHADAVSGDYPESRVFDGKTMHEYCLSAELSSTSTDGSRMAGIGIICHEFGHTLGLSDYYNFQYFALMALGCDNNYEATPPYLTILERDQLRWLSWKDIPVLKSGQTTISSIKDGTAFRSNTNQYGEFFVYEYRDGTGWDAAIPAGMLVYHMDRSTAVNTQHPLQCLVPAADPSNYNYQGKLANILFPSETGVTSFNPVDWTGNPTMYQLSNIHKSGNSMVFNTTISPTRVLNGRVLDAIGNPQANLTVEAWLLADAGDGTHAFTDHETQYLTTDSDGKFSLTIDSSFDDPKMGPVVGAVIMIRSADYSETVYMYSPTQSLEIIITGQGQEEQTWSTYKDAGSPSRWNMKGYADVVDHNQIMYAARIPASQLPSEGGSISSFTYIHNMGKTYVIVDAVKSNGGSERILTYEVPDNALVGRSGQEVTIDLRSLHAQFPGGRDLMVGYAVSQPANYSFSEPYCSWTEQGNFWYAGLNTDVSTWQSLSNWGWTLACKLSYYPFGDTPGPGPGTDDPIASILDCNCIADPGNGVYTAGSSFKLQIAEGNAGVSVTSVQWSLDGQSVSGDSVTLSAGSHIIKAVASFSDGSKETLELHLKAQ